MKSFFTSAILGTLAVALPSVGRATPLDPSHLPAEAQWVVHVDMEAVRASEMGQYLISEVLAKRIPAQSGLSIDPVAVAAVVDGITVYGEVVNFDPESMQQSGVVVIDGRPEFGAIVKGWLAYASMEEGVTFIQQEPYPVIQMEDGMMAAVLNERRVVIGKSLANLEQFNATAAGKHPSLVGTDRFASFVGAPSGRAILAMVGGLDQLAGAEGAQARVFQLSRGLMASLDERGGNLSLTVSLETDSAENATRLQQILQGLLAIASLTKMDDENLSTLLRSTGVRKDERSVFLEVAFPAQRIISMVNQVLPPIDLASDRTGGETLAVKVVRSSADASCCVENLGDDDPQTSWVTNGRKLTATFELVETIRLETVGLSWPEGVKGGFSFTLASSTDGQNWERRIVWDGGDLPPESVALTPVDARFLRIGLERSDDGPLGLRSLRLNGVRPELRSAHSSGDSVMLPSNLFDNDPSTQFGPAEGSVMVEGRLAGTARVQEIGFLWADGGERQIQVLASPDGIEWERILAIAQGVAGAELQRFNAHDIETRYLRFVAPDAGRWGPLEEIRVYGVPR